MLSDRHLAAVVNEAEVQRLFDGRAIEAARTRLPGRRGCSRLARVLAAYAEVPGYTTSEAERRFVSLCAEHGLPRPQRIALAGYELDFYWSDARLAVEVDGRAFHRTRRAFHEDRRRDRRLAGLGIQVVRVPWRDLAVGAADLVGELTAIRGERCATLTRAARSPSVRP